MLSSWGAVRPGDDAMVAAEELDQQPLEPGSSR